MKKLGILIYIFVATSASAQNSKDFNFILVVDEAVWISYTSLKIEIRDSTESLTQSVSALYYPGNLSFEQSDYKKLLAAKGDSMTLIVNYKEQKKDKDEYHIFELPFSVSWLDNYFMVMRVYNLDTKKYKGLFEPLDRERNYTYELAYPGGQMLRVRNKSRK